MILFVLLLLSYGQQKKTISFIRIFNLFFVTVSYRVSSIAKSLNYKSETTIIPIKNSTDSNLLLRKKDEIINEEKDNSEQLEKLNSQVVNYFIKSHMKTLNVNLTEEVNNFNPKENVFQSVIFLYKEFRKAFRLNFI